MTLSEYKTLSMEGDTQFVNTTFKFWQFKTWVSNLIRMACKAPNHSFMIFKEGDEWVAIGARTPVVRKTTLEYELIGNRVTVKRKKVDDIEKKRAYMYSKLGTPYDYESLLIFQPIQLIFHIWLGPVGFKARKADYCYELTAETNEYPNPSSLNPIEYFNWNGYETIIDNELITE